MIELIDKRLVSGKDQLIDCLKEFLEKKFQISGLNAKRYLDELTFRYLEQMNYPNLTFLVEYPYTDKVYLNSFYHYFASKLYTYKRDCIRVSVFRNGIKPSNFRNPSEI